MLATLTDRRDFGDDWLLDASSTASARCPKRRRRGPARVATGKHLTSTYPDVRAALDAQRLDRFLLDGEVVVFDGDQTSFSRLQQRLGTTRRPRR